MTYNDLATLGQRIRHFRNQRSWTLERLSKATGVAVSQLSLVENGKREPRISLLRSISEALEVPLGELASNEPPSKRAALELSLQRLQETSVYGALGLPKVRPTKAIPTTMLESLVGLHEELVRRNEATIATPEEARIANTQLRLEMRERNNYLPDIEDLAEEMLREAGYGVGPLTHSTVARMAGAIGLEIIHVHDLPHSTRTVTDLENGRIYLPPASIPGGHGLRSLALQAIAHRLLGHSRPRNYAEFLRQRIEINYYAAACLLPRTPAVEFLGAAKQAKDLAVEDFRDAFGVTHETAAMRLTNLATSYLDLPVHVLRVGSQGTVFKGYENDEVPFPVDANNAIEGQVTCRKWAARMVFEQENRSTEFYQYTDTPAGTFWCTAQTGSTTAGEFSITFGTPYAHAKWFRGRSTSFRTESTCPDSNCCRRPSPQLAKRWENNSWPSATLHAHILEPLPIGIFPGVHDTEVYEFLERHAPSEN